MAIDVQKLCGWVDDPKAVAELVATLPHPSFADAIAPLASPERKDTYLWYPQLWAWPGYRRGSQGTDDCTSWGTARTCDLVTALMAWEVGDKSLYFTTATEPIYGGARCEIRGIRDAGSGRGGSVPGYAMKWIRDYGVLHRKDYSAETGNPLHNLTAYKTNTALEMGRYGCGGKNDTSLDDLARSNPIMDFTPVKNFDEVHYSISVLKRPVVGGSQYASEGYKRNKYGELTWRGSWNHCQMFSAVRGGQRPAAWKDNSWGDIYSGPGGEEYCDDLPEGGIPKAVLASGGWEPAEDIDKEIRRGEFYSVGRYAEFAIPQVDLTTPLTSGPFAW